MKTLILIITLVGAKGAAVTSQSVVEENIPAQQCETLAQSMRLTRTHKDCGSGYCWHVIETREGVCI